VSSQKPAQPVTPLEPDEQEQQSSERSLIVRGAAIIMVGTILSRILGLVREQITSWLFGTGDAVAAFTIADNIHTMLFDLVISGMMQAALVPVLSAYATPKLKHELRRIVGALLMMAILVIGGAVVLMEIFAPQVVTVMTALGGGAEARDPETVELTVQLVRMILPAVLLLSISTILMSTLYAMQRFTRPALSLAARNAAIVAVMLMLGRSDFGIRSIVVGILLGAVIMIAIQAPGLKDVMPRPNFNFRHPAIKKILVLYVPIFIGLVSNTVALVVDRNLAWGVDPNALGAMRYATAFNQMILGIVAAAISLAALPTLSRHFASGDDNAFQRTLSNGLKMVTIMVVPATLGLAAVSWPAVDLFFFHGATDEVGARAIQLALLAYLPGTFFAAYDQVLIFSYYARQNTRTPVIVGVVAVGVYFVVALSLIGSLGMVGLVLANSAQFTFHATVMWFLLRRSMGRVGDETVGRTIRIALSVGLIMAVVVFGISQGMQQLPIPGHDTESGLMAILHQTLMLVIPVGIGGIIYVAGLWKLGVEEIRTVIIGILNKIRLRRRNNES
jgi:putative peptidoglycan lipid II flippase